MDDISLIQKGLCTQKEKEKCLSEFGEALLQWQCENCPVGKPEMISEYTWKMMRVYNLQQGGYPYHANDLTLEEWEDLGRMKVKLNPQTCPFIRSDKK